MKIMFPALSTPTGLRLALPLLPRRACLWTTLAWAVLAFVAESNGAGVTEAWVQRSNILVSNSQDRAYKIVRDAAGDIIVTGSSDNGTSGLDMLTIKYSGADGSVLWQKRYNGPANSDDSPTALAVDGTGNVVVTGYSTTATNSDLYTAKYAAADGALLWEKRYDGPANGDDFPNAVAVDATGNVAVTGSSYNGTNKDFYTAKYAAADGALLWEKRYNAPAPGYDSSPAALAVDSSGNVVVTGYTVSAGFYNDFYTAKYAAADGALLWEQIYNSPADKEDTARAVALDGSGNVIVTGVSYGNSPTAGGSDADYYTAKYAAADGTLLWEQIYNSPGNGADGARAVAVDGRGNVVVAGSYYNGNNYDYYTAKYAGTNGALLWERTYNGSGNGDNAAVAMALDSSGNVVVTGYAYNGANADFYTAKYAAADGKLLWEQTYNGPANHDDKAVAVAVDGSGNVVVTGSSRVDSLGGQPSDYYTAKYAAADGALLWEQRYDGPAHDEDIPAAVAVDAIGDVVVTGLSFATAANTDYYTVKYAGADGALLWQKRSSSGDSAPTAMALDASGNVVVTGESNRDFYTVKYAGANGTLLWQRRYNSPANDEDGATAVAVDRSGNVIVTGWTYNYAANYGVDSYTAKYAASNGALLWQKPYNGTGGSGNDQLFAVAVDKSDNVVVAGYSNDDCYTASYAAKDGALVWEKPYNGPANGADSATSLALGPDGVVVVAGWSDRTFRYGATGIMTTVVYREPLPPISIAMVPAGVHLHFTGVPGHGYNIERAPAVTGPWSTIATSTAPPGGLIDYTDMDPPTSSAFYRTSTQ